MVAAEHQAFVSCDIKRIAGIGGRDRTVFHDLVSAVDAVYICLHGDHIAIQVVIDMIRYQKDIYVRDVGETIGLSILQTVDHGLIPCHIVFISGRQCGFLRRGLCGRLRRVIGCLFSRRSCLRGVLFGDSLFRGGLCFCIVSCRGLSAAGGHEYCCSK